MSEQDRVLHSLRDLIHELKDPFAAIHGGIDLSFQEGFSAQEREHLRQSMSRNSQAMRRLLEDAGVYLGLLTDPPDPKPETVSLNSLLGQVLEEIGPQLAVREQSAKLVPGADFHARIDAAAVRRAMACLLGALSRVSHQGVVFAVEASVQTPDLSLSLSTGGSPWRLKENDFRQALAQRLATWLGGSVMVESGERIVFKIPCLKVESGPVSQTMSPDLSVLVADGNQDGADTMAMWLEAQGFKVTVAYQAEQALRLIQTESPQAVVLDMDLPGAPFEELVRRARSGGFAGRLFALGEQGEEIATVERTVPKHVDLSTLTSLLREPSPPGVQSVLVVEDNPVALQVTLRLLEGLGLEAIGATTAHEGLDLVAERKPDLILCDLGLPGELDGFDLARALPDGPPKIAVTGDAAGSIEKALAAGFEFVLEKPLGVSALTNLLERVGGLPT